MSCITFDNTRITSEWGFNSLPNPPHLLYADHDPQREEQVSESSDARRRDRRGVVESGVDRQHSVWQSDPQLFELHGQCDGQLPPG